MIKKLSNLIGWTCMSLIADAQLPNCPQQPGQIPDFSGTFIQVNPNSLSQTISNDGVYTAGEVFRYTNALTVPRNINAYVYIEAMQNAVLASFDNNNTGVASRFQPRITPNPGDLATATQEGWVQFRVEFRNNGGPLDGQLINLAPGLQFRHLDIDGYSRGTTGSFRETGWTTGQTGAYFLSPTDLTNDGAVQDGGYNWIKVLGQTSEHAGPSSDENVIYVSQFGVVNTVRFRMGYLFTRGDGGNVADQPTREYVAEFGCFDLSNNIPLPVKLTGFIGTYKNEKAVLNWQTAEEVNFSRFEVERSNNGTDYTKAGIVMATGGIARTTSYEFPDDLSVTGGSHFYYRLKMVDIDEQFVYSPVILIRTDNTAASGLSVFPNPVTGEYIQLKLSASSRNTIEIRITDLNGRVLSRQAQTVSSGNNSIPVKLPALQAGTYVLQVISNGKTENSKFSVAR